MKQRSEGIMASTEINVVTGAFGYTGRYIADRLLSMGKGVRTLGKGVRTLTGHPSRDNPYGDRVEVFPFNFDRPDELADTLRGAATLYNTYWIRFPRRKLTFDRAVENTRTLIEAAKRAGVQRLVHLSITNAFVESPLPYFRGKGLVEKAIVESGLSYAILRPTVIFGAEGVLLNNIAWFLRRFPLFPVAGSGEYRVQPVSVEDIVELAVRAGQQDDNTAIDAVGPETYTFSELVLLIAHAIGSRTRIVRTSPGVLFFLARITGLLLRDVVLTKDEIRGLIAGLLVSEDPPTGDTRLSEWLQENRDRIGVSYASELRRHY